MANPLNVDKSREILSETTATLEKAFGLVEGLEKQFRLLRNPVPDDLAFYPGPLDEDIRAAARALEEALIRCHLELGVLS